VVGGVDNRGSDFNGDIGGPPRNTSKGGSLTPFRFWICCGGKGGEGSEVGNDAARRELGEYIGLVEDGDTIGGCVEGLVKASCWNLASEAVVAARCCIRSADAFAWRRCDDQHSLSEVQGLATIGEPSLDSLGMREAGLPPSPSPTPSANAGSLPPIFYIGPQVP
jgi:hypothetical protein